MARIGIYLPKYCRVGNEHRLQSLDEDVVRRETLRIAKRLTDLTGGCTSLEVTGYYKFSDGFFSEAPTVELYCICEDKDSGKIAQELKPFLADIKLRLNQVSVGMYVESRTKFVEA